MPTKNITLSNLFGRHNKFGFIVLILIALAAVGVAATRQPKSSYLKVKDQETVSYLRQVMDLPAEKPTVATVSDKSKLGDQQFLAKAENGDKVVIFVEAKQAILFRPSIKKIISVGPIIISEATPNP